MTKIKNQHGEFLTDSKNGRPSKTKSGVKINNKTKKAQTGRPPLIPATDNKKELLSDIVVSKLIEIFQMDGTVEEACSHAEISRDTFYRHLNDNPAFADIITNARQKSYILARLAIFGAIARGDEKTAQWFLERKKRNEFAPKLITENPENSSLPFKIEDIDVSTLSDQELDQLESLLNKVEIKEKLDEPKI